MERKRIVIQEQACLAGKTRISRECGLAVLFFSGLWGLSEATLGDALYSAGIACASVPLTVIGFMVLTLARAYFPQLGTATLIASCAMLYKFLNAPFFACHLLGILLMGICYDVFFNVLKIKRLWLGAGLATYANYSGFALMITYVARYEHWVRGGPVKIFVHIGIEGSMAAIACAVLVPLTMRFGGRLRRAVPAPFAPQASPIPCGIAGLTIGLWVLGTATYLFGPGLGG